MELQFNKLHFKFFWNSEATSGKLPYIRYLINVRPSSLELREGYIPVHVSDCLNLDPFFTKELFSMVFFRLYAPVQARYDS